VPLFLFEGGVKVKIIIDGIFDGCGKSTACKKVGEYFDIPVIHPIRTFCDYDDFVASSKSQQRQIVIDIFNRINSLKGDFVLDRGDISAYIYQDLYYEIKTPYKYLITSRPLVKKDFPFGKPNVMEWRKASYILDYTNIRYNYFDDIKKLEELKCH
jgi:hypothetical protein